MKRTAKRTLRLERLEDRQLLSVSPVAPVISKPIPRTSIETATSTFTFAFSDANAGDTHAAAVDWGDGSPYTHLDSVTSPFSVEHRYESTGTYSPRLWVTDSTNRTDIESFRMKVYPHPSYKLVPPAINTIGDRTAIAGATVAVDFEFRDPNNNDRFGAEIDWGDGTEPDRVSVNRSFTLEHFYDQVGTFTPTLTVTDSTDRSDTETFSMTIYPNTANPNWRFRAPVLEPESTRTAFSRIENTYTYFFTDLNRNDTFTAAVDWGDGTPLLQLDESNIQEWGDLYRLDATHRFENVGTYTPKVWVTDSSGRSDSIEYTMKVYPNPGPGIINTGPQIGYVLSPTRIELELIDHEPSESYYLDVRWGDTEQNVQNADRDGYIPTVPGRETIEHTYYFPGTYEITAHVAETGEIFNEARTFPVTISNHPDAPVLKSLGEQTTLVYEETEFKFEFDDDTPSDTHALLFCSRPLSYITEFAWIENPDAPGYGNPCERRLVSSPATFHHVYQYETTIQPEVWISDELGRTGYYRPVELRVVEGSVPPYFIDEEPCSSTNVAHWATCEIRFLDNNDDSHYNITMDWGNGFVESFRPRLPYYDKSLITGHNYGQNGRYLITISVMDSTGLESTLQQWVDINL